ncbi:MAG: hypothetical protein JXB88_25145 [Spirochaetales bacterium]|nr:hypothetical protein [Spirochaetales bacterium]
MKTNRIFITFIIVLFILCGIIHAQENLIKNPSFELLDSEGNPKNWATHSWIKDDSVTRFEVDTKVAYTGSKSVAVNNMKKNHGYYIQNVTVKANSFYRVTGWVRTENVGENLEGAGISVIDYFEVGGDFRGTTPWQFAELYISTGPDTSHIEIMLQVGNYGAENTGKAWFDDISMIKVNSLPAGAKVTVMEKNEDSLQSGAEKGKKKTIIKDKKINGTLALLIIIIIIVIVVGIAVVILIILTRKKPGTTGEQEDTNGPGEDTSDPGTNTT